MIVDPARLILAGFVGTRADDPGVVPLLKLGVGGFIVFGRNVESPAQVHELLAGLTAGTVGPPPLLAVDQEGGRVARLKAPLTVWPPMARLGASADASLARNVGRALAAEIGAVGFNLVFAPVLDVRFEGTTDAIGDRSFGDDPKRVAELGLAFADGIADAGLLSCAKHFPGHGHVTVDSHIDLPVCELDEDELRRDHIAPFAAAADAGIPMIMSAHIVTALDREHPATLSPRLMTDVLRKELGFSGVVLTDDMEMGAIAKRRGIPEACAAAVRAGVDGVLICRDLDAIEATAAHFRAEAAADPAFAARCDESAARLAAAAASAPPRPASSADLADAVGRAEHQALATRISAPGTTGVDPTRAHLA